MNLWQKLQFRKKFVQVCKTANLYLGSDEHPIFPQIQAVTTSDNSTTLTFSIPNGLDPKLLKKNQFVFEQYYGENIELKGEIKRFTLTVYNIRISTNLPYNYKEYAEPFKGLKLPIVCGVDANRNTIAYDMVENPHLLIAGETGSGKSTQLRSVLTSLIKALPPEQLEMYLADLKRSEFHLFRNVDHVKGIYHSAKQMIPMLHYLQNEMKRRGDLLDAHEVSHVDDLAKPLPYLLLCIDEVALLQDEKELMKLVEEISAIGRALGVFLILSMQRPSREVVDGKLKNNLTVRMGFKCADLINSRIIGTPGSEKLKVKGRMLLKVPIYSELKEVQAPYLSLDEAKKLLAPYKSNPSKKSNTDKTKPSKVIDLQELETNIFGVLDDDH